VQSGLPKKHLTIVPLVSSDCCTSPSPSRVGCGININLSSFRMVCNTTRGWRCVALAGVLALFAMPSWAGTEALYRYALRHWPPEIYQVIVFHHEPISEDARKLIDLLFSAPQTSGANMVVSVVDTTEPMAEPMQTLWYTQTGVEPPWVVVTNPEASEAAPPIWAGSLGAEAVSALLDSPARRKIADGLLGGDAAVWVLLECGDAIRDEAAVDLLAAELKRQEPRLSSRVTKTNATASSAVDAVKGGFSLVRVTRNDAAEEFFVTNLLNGAALSHTKPMAFPVYGRGRTLPALVGRRLSAESIVATCRFITGACTNESKAANPGKDLLVSAQWDAPGDPTNSPATVSLPVAPAPAVPLNGPIVAASSTVETNSSLASEKSSSAASSNTGSYLRIGLIIAVLTGVIGFFALRPRGGS